MNKKKKEKKINIIILSTSIFIFIILGVVIYDEIEKLSNSYFYDFEDDEIGSYPSGFVGNFRDTSSTKVIYFDDIHKNVVEVKYLEEPPHNPLDYGGMEFNTLFGLTESGIIEFDVYLLTNDGFGIDICQSDSEYDSADDIQINFDDGDIRIFNGFGAYNKISTYSTKKWHHFKIKYNLDEWSIWIDNNLKKENIKYYRNPPYFCQLYFSTYVLGQVFYVDNIRITKLGVI